MAIKKTFIEKLKTRVGIALMVALTLFVLGATYVMVSGGFININFESGDTKASISTGQIKKD